MSFMLINATQKEELRVAILDNESLSEIDILEIENTSKPQDSNKNKYNSGRAQPKLVDLDLEHLGHELKKGNIYLGKITRNEPSLEAVFVDYGAERHGFLSYKEISPTYYSHLSSSQDDKVNLRDALKEGQQVIVQIVKEERGNKGAALTTFISLAGCFLVLMPNSPRAGGISRRIEGDERDEMREVLAQLDMPEEMGLIVRTAGVGRDLEDLQWDLNILKTHWEAIKQAAQARPAPFLIHQESEVVTRSIRDYLRKEVTELIIDNHDVFIKARNYIQLVRPDFIHRIRLYQDNIPLFTRYQVERQIEMAFQREVRLPSGGVIVFDPTEALISIDVNSGKDTKGYDIEQTALNTNLEAAEEIARQLRLRDLGGLIVIDFIDMTPFKNQKEVENRLRKALKNDRARVQIGPISRFGLLEMSRQRLRPTLGEFYQLPCPHCKGLGFVRSIESFGISILRVLEESTMKPNVTQVQLQLPVGVATYLMNERRSYIVDIERRHHVNVIIIPNPYLEAGDYKIISYKADEAVYVPQPSYELLEKPEIEAEAKTLDAGQVEQPAVRDVYAKASQPEKKTGPGLIKRLLQHLFGSTGHPKKLQAQEGSEQDRNGRRRSNNGPQRRNYDKDNQSSSRRRRRSRNDQRRSNKRSGDYRKGDKPQANEDQKESSNASKSKEVIPPPAVQEESR